MSETNLKTINSSDETDDKKPSMNGETCLLGPVKDIKVEKSIQSIKTLDLNNSSNDVVSPDLDTLKPVISKRSASDGASKITCDLLLPHQRSCSAVDLRTAYMKARIDDKIQMLEKELNISLTRKVPSETDVSSELPDKFDMKNFGQIPRGRSFSIDEMKESALNRLQEELNKVQKELKLKDKEVFKLSKIRDEVGYELEDLTASLFEEANKMVHDAKVKQARAERLLIESNMKVDVLEGEVTALKTIIQIAMPQKKPPPTKFEGVKALFRPKQASSMEAGPVNPSPSISDSLVDPIYNQNFIDWRQNPTLDKTNPFLDNIYQEEIMPALAFANKELSAQILVAIENNNIVVEAASNKRPYPKHCALLNRPRLCTYVVKFGSDKVHPGHDISTLCRNRIAAVCDFFCYLRYIQQGLVKNSIHEVYWEVMDKRKNICMARLGVYTP